MSLTDYVILALLALFLLYAIYDEFLMERRRGETRLKVLLQRRNKLDSLIFIGLIAILIYHNITAQGPKITTLLLMVLAFIAIYTFWIRRPKLIFKVEGFFFANVWVDYSRIKGMNLSEDGVLVLQLEHRRLLIHVKELDDLEKIYKVMIENQ
ncbi:DUF986 family protein [Erwiniaceae bacterium BAC15a-03b]|uniref:UPF0266 membrane protein N5923_17810 n=1 Tax=Winslowiella arboricola TaxID=2978220 RepID=A0A9J6PZB1_9GAMM|nr:DUF986 family protein [Winslowiella arboricola]MCU5775807.1 DUF986 family protein [Winslowiella arboricola]MCU5779343.1 DUF986 family protein [Winslowiella arboricola]